MWKLGERTCDIVWATQRIPDVFAAIREVVSNSIDADATAILIALGTDDFSFTVNDNGHGIQAKDLCALVCTWPATSKTACIRENGYRYAGWRGDSLLCISKLSKVSIESREDSSWNTYRKIVERGDTKCMGRVSSKKFIPGTVVTVHDLFGNVPGRQRHMMGTMAQRSKMIEKLKQFCLRMCIMRGSIAFDIIDKRTNSSILRLAPSSSPQEKFALLCDCRDEFQEIDFTSANGQYCVKGYGVKDAFEITRVNLKRAMLWSQCVSFNDLWLQGFETLCTTRIYNFVRSRNYDIPVLIINLLAPDTNYVLQDNEDGRTVQFRQHDQFEQFFDSFLHEFCAKCPGTPEGIIDGTTEESQETFKQENHQDEWQHASGQNPMKEATTNIAYDEFSNLIWACMPNRHTDNRMACNPILEPSRLRIRSKYFLETIPSGVKAISKKTTNKPSFYPRLFKKQLSVLASNAYTRRRMAIKIPSSIFQHFRVLQQVDFKFILAVSSSPPLLVCIDQHAADERVKLEALENSLLNAPFPSHQVQSIALILNESEKSLVVRNNETLLFWGFEVDISTWTLNRVPIVDHREATDDDLLEYLCLLSSMSGSFVRPPIITRLLHSRACRSAVMFGDPLTLDECQILITQLGACRLPFQCAHGRPSIVPLAQFTL
ncbi:hypothetical protein AeRB84_010351 [Aphanomyces euteiches]|nr:hypothetical protein AeRB84_010351 [Aphanomyces euteiches]